MYKKEKKDRSNWNENRAKVQYVGMSASLASNNSDIGNNVAVVSNHGAMKREE